MTTMPIRQTNNYSNHPIQKHEQHEDLLMVHEVALRLRVDDTTVRRWIKEGSLAAVKLPHLGKRQKYRIRRSDIEALFVTSN